MSMVRRPKVRSFVTSLLAGCVLAACGGDDPAPFNPSGMAEDMEAFDAPFQSGAAASFGYFSDAIDNTFGSEMLSSSLRMVHGAAHAKRDGFFASALAARQSMKGLLAHRSTSVALAVIGEEYLGKTYIYDPGASHYVLSERTGAPANGVRFIVYAVNPISHALVEPLEEVGYADLLDQSTGSTDAIRVQLVSEGVTCFDYGVSGSSTATSEQVVVDGYVTDGTTRVNFDLDARAVSNGTSSTLTYDYTLGIPSREVDFDYTIILASNEEEVTTVDVDLSASGPNGSVGIEGTLHDGPSVLTARVNGDDFARMNMDGESLVSITNPQGGELTAQETTALGYVWLVVLKGLDIFGQLLDPLDNLTM